MARYAYCVLGVRAVLAAEQLIDALLGCLDVGAILAGNYKPLFNSHHGHGFNRVSIFAVRQSEAFLFDLVTEFLQVRCADFRHLDGAHVLLVFDESEIPWNPSMVGLKQKDRCPVKSSGLICGEGWLVNYSSSSRWIFVRCRAFHCPEW